MGGSAQVRAILRSSTSTLSWEQTIVTKTPKTLFVNAFIAWRMCEKRDLLQTRSTFGSLDNYRHSLSCVQSLADFAFDCSRELLAHADKVEKETLRNNPEDDEDEALSDREFERIRLLAGRKKRNRLAFFNGSEGKRLRLSNRGHEQRQKRPPMFCALCGTGTQSGDRPSKYSQVCLMCCSFVY